VELLGYDKLEEKREGGERVSLVDISPIASQCNYGFMNSLSVSWTKGLPLYEIHINESSQISIDDTASLTFS
jgi:hypothetical protein